MTWHLNESGVLTISGTGRMYDYSIDDYTYAPWYEQRKSMTDVQIDNRVSYIGNAAFYECSMTSVTLPESLTEIGEYAFKGSALTSITVPNAVEKIGVGAFSSVAYLKTAVLPDKLTVISKKLFEQDFRLLDVTIPSNLQRIEESAFSQCYGLKRVRLAPVVY